MTQISFHSPLGDLTLTEEEGMIVSLDWGRAPQSEKNNLLVKAKNLLL